MPYKILADFTILLHFLWIVFLIIGGLWGRRRRAVRYVHVGGLGFAFVINLFGLYCPLTYLEVWLRARHSPGAAYAGSFIAHYMEKLIYIPVSQTALLGLTLLLLAFNAWVYLGRKRR